MNSKQLVMAAIKNQETPRAPWVPYVGCHGAFLLDVSAEDYFKSDELLYRGAMKAYELYRPDGLPAMFDLQVEAEAMGCGVRYERGNPPAVVTHPMEQGKDLADLKLPGKDDGRFPTVLAATRRIAEALGDKIAVYGLITGPFTLALHLMGTDIFYAMMDEPERVTALMELTRDVCIQTARWYLEAGCDVIAVVDPMVSQISPANFDEFVMEPAKAIFADIRAQDKAGCFFVCGNAKRNIESMAQCGCDNISFDENIPLEYVKEVAGRYGVSVGGNLHLTVALLFGTPMDNIIDARDCLAKGGTKGYILAPGCDMPFETPIDNVKAVVSVVHGEDDAFIGQEGGLAGIEVNVPDYANEAQAIADIITLDSDSCAPCQYMMEAVRAAAEGLPVTVIEHKVKLKHEVAFMVRMGVSHIPTILVDGVMRYESIIPAVEELRATFQAAVDAKAK